jgi:hypothetical protein
MDIVIKGGTPQKRDCVTFVEDAGATTLAVAPDEASVKVEVLIVIDLWLTGSREEIGSGGPCGPVSVPEPDACELVSR